jgi:hypothetical protein
LVGRAAGLAFFIPPLTFGMGFLVFKSHHSPVVSINLSVLPGRFGTYGLYDYMYFRKDRLMGWQASSEL